MLKIVVFLGFMVAFAAGLAVGMQSKARFAAAPTTRPSGPGGWLVKELNLNPQQQEQLNKIWSETARHGGREQDDRRRQLRRERDDAIAALIPPEQKGKFDQLTKDYSDQTSALESQWRSSFHASVEKTKQILTPEQRKKYEELLSRHQWDRDRNSREQANGRRGEDRATSRPASQR